VSGFGSLILLQVFVEIPEMPIHPPLGFIVGLSPRNNPRHADPHSSKCQSLLNKNIE
jgi:hypothetical protein